MNCLWAIIDARRSWRRRLSLILRINFDQFPRLTINNLFALLRWLKGVRYFLSASGAYSLLFILLRRLRLFKPVIEKSDAKKQNFFFLRIALVILPGIQYNTRQCLGQTKRALLHHNQFSFLFFSAIFSLYLRKRKNENQVFFCKQARRETLISLRSSSSFAQPLVWMGRWFLPIR